MLLYLNLHKVLSVIGWTATVITGFMCMSKKQKKSGKCKCCNRG